MNDTTIIISEITRLLSQCDYLTLSAIYNAVYKLVEKPETLSVYDFINRLF